MEDKTFDIYTEFLESVQQKSANRSGSVIAAHDLIIQLPGLLDEYNIQLPPTVARVLFMLDDNVLVCITGLFGFCSDKCINCQEIRKNVPLAEWIGWTEQHKAQVLNTGAPKKDKPTHSRQVEMSLVPRQESEIIPVPGQYKAHVLHIDVPKPKKDKQSHFREDKIIPVPIQESEMLHVPIQGVMTHVPRREKTRTDFHLLPARNSMDSYQSVPISVDKQREFHFYSPPEPLMIFDPPSTPLSRSPHFIPESTSSTMNGARSPVMFQQQSEPQKGNFGSVQLSSTKMEPKRDKLDTDNRAFSFTRESSKNPKPMLETSPPQKRPSNQFPVPSTENTKPCRFQDNCKNPQCAFLHPELLDCKFDKNVNGCTKCECPYIHNKNHAKYASTKCEFGKNCARRRCGYKHPTN